MIAQLNPAAELYGRDDFQSAQVDQWLEFAWNEVEVPAAVCLFPARGLLEKDDAAAAMAKQDLLTSLGHVLENHLAERTFLVGQRPSLAALADVGLAPIVGTLLASGLFTPEDKKSLVKVVRWCTTCLHQPAFAEVVGSLQGLGDGSSSLSPAAAGAFPEVVMSTPAPNGAFQSKFRRSRTRIREMLQDCKSKVGNEFTVKGWVRTSREADRGKLVFLEVNDGSCLSGVQVIASLADTRGFAQAKACGGAGASLAVTGTLVESPAKGQEVELQASGVEVLGPVYGGDNGAVGGKFYPLSKKFHTLEHLRDVATCAPDAVGGKFYPLSKKFHTLEHLRDVAHLRARSKIHSAVMRVRHAMAFASHQFFNERGFLYIHTPLITAADCEGAGEQFCVTTLVEDKPNPEPLPRQKNGDIDYSKDFFARRTSLTVSGQLNVETHACALGDVYTFGPTFRAENSHTSRHLAEFWMIEPEFTFGDIFDDMDLAEDYLKFLVAYALQHCQEDLHFFENFPGGEKGLRDRLKNVLDNDFVRITYTQAIDLLQQEVKAGKVTFEEEPVWGIDMGSEHERYITEKVYQKPTIVRDYPKDIKAFYMKLNDDKRTVAAMDILVPKIGEIIGGSQREEDAQVLAQRSQECGLEPEMIWWYMDLRKYGTVKHAGFGLGFERLLLFVTGLDNIRDVIPFPRVPGKAEF
eukprot:CAMPEP_0113952982 /NCGR_PEP_ID=MMETSP1339-20121228/90724_1 /TAXON_ID=94617 /ORGANISM="Fibrocapsa japonica" /LENGTH=691 /DNA_ID=CAMNT_0000961669 /DNA_START=229 /DNA_END=2306 /DNA_ORIENTATION=- /assembly_acc=CAM_ASM_000762